MKRCIITPTYINHFSYIEKYLESFSKYVVDKNFPIYFIVNEEERSVLENITGFYKNDLNINIINYENVLEKYGIKDSPDVMLNTIGRLSYQTIKKYYSARFIGAEQFLVLDSESIMIRPTELNKLFDAYFSNKEFFVSSIADRPEEFKEKFTYSFVTLASSITGYAPDYWPLESYNWFLELSIVEDMIAQFGELYEFIKKAKLPCKFKDEGIEGELLYYPFIMNSAGNYGYKIYDSSEELKKHLGVVEFEKFYLSFHNSWRSHGGYLEGLACFITKENIKQITTFVKEHCMPIFRISRIIGENKASLDINAQKEFINNIQPNILASSYTEMYYNEYVKKN